MQQRKRSKKKKNNSHTIISYCKFIHVLFSSQQHFQSLIAVIKKQRHKQLKTKTKHKTNESKIKISKKLTIHDYKSLFIMKNLV